jgi:hypothetical protein
MSIGKNSNQIKPAATCQQRIIATVKWLEIGNKGGALKKSDLKAHYSHRKVVL